MKGKTASEIKKDVRAAIIDLLIKYKKQNNKKLIAHFSLETGYSENFIQKIIDQMLIVDDIYINDDGDLFLSMNKKQYLGIK